MSFTITCPICGKRNAYEFRYGEVDRGPRPTETEMTPQKWVQYVHMRPNTGGCQKEWWCHRQGCGLWFTIVRDTLTNVEVTERDLAPCKD